MRRRRLLTGLGTLCLGSGALVVGTDALTSEEATRTNDVDVVDDANAFLQADVEPGSPIIVGTSTSEIKDLAQVTNGFPNGADITFVDQDTGDSIVFYDGSEVSSPYTFSNVAAGDSVSIDVDINGSSKNTFNYTVRGETGDTTVTLDKQFDANGFEGLIGYYPFEDGGENDQEVAVDRSGNGNDGTLYDGADFVTGQVGNAREFLNDDYGEVPLASTFESGSFTVSLWTRIDDISDDQLLFGVFDSTTDGENFSLQHRGGNNKVEASYDLGSTVVITSTTVSESVWHQFAVTYDDSTGETSLYFDGSLDDSGNVGSFTGTSPQVTFGNWRGMNYNANLLIDEIRVYTRALPADEIDKIYQATN
jgi:hypothetical protein